MSVSSDRRAEAAAVGSSIRAKAPLRISFAGGGTDVPPYPEREGGLVLNATINRYAHGTLLPRDDERIHIQSLDLGISAAYDGRQALVFDGRLDLAKSAIREIGDIHAGLDLMLYSNVPPGSGLGSSSTMMVTLVGLLAAFHRLSLTTYELAELAHHLERERLGIKGGLQDHYAAAFGGFNFIEFGGGQTVVNPLRVADDTILELEHNLLLCYTGETRQSDRIIEDQTARFEGDEDATLEGLRRQKELAVAMKETLLRGDLRSFGALLGDAWEAKKLMSPRITTERIEEMYDEARRHGAIGGKVTGAGGGGFMLLYCDDRRKHEVAAVLERMGARVDEFAFAIDGLRTWRVSG